MNKNLNSLTLECYIVVFCVLHENLSTILYLKTIKLNSNGLATICPKLIRHSTQPTLVLTI